MVLAFSAPVRAGDVWAPYEDSFLETSAKLLSGLYTTKAHFKFIRRNHVGLKVVPPGGALGKDAIAANDKDAGAMLINKIRLIDGVRELKSKGVSDQRIGAVLAWKTIPTIIHELRHAMVNEELERKGIYFERTVIEEEWICFLDMMRVMTEAMGKRPDLWRRNMILDIEKSNAVVLRSLDRDTRTFKRLVAQNYEDLPSILTGKRSWFVAKTKKTIAELSESEQGLREVLADAGPRRAEAQKSMERSKSLRHGFEDDLRILVDDERYKQLVGYYRKKLAWIEKKAVEIRSATW